MAKFDDITNKLNSVTDTVRGFADTADTVAATAGNVVGSFKNGMNNPNGRAINDIEVTAEIGDGVKFLGFALVAAFVLVFLKTKKR